MFNRFAYLLLASRLPARKPIGKSHQNGDYLKQAMRKSCLPTGFEPAAFGLKIRTLACKRQKHHN